MNLHKHKHKNIYLPTHIHIYIYTYSHVLIHLPSVHHSCVLPVNVLYFSVVQEPLKVFGKESFFKSWWSGIVLFFFILYIYIFFLNKHVPGLRRTSKSTFFLCSSTLHGKQLFRNVSARKWCKASGSPRPAFIQPRRWKRSRWRSGVSADCGNSM